MSRSVLLVSIMLAGAGCIVVGPRSLPIDEPPAVLGPSATVVVFREDQFCGSTPLNYIVVDEKPIAALATGQHTVFQLKKGIHTLKISFYVLYGGSHKWISGRFDSKAITREFLAETTYYFWVKSKCLSFNTNEKVTIEQVDRWPEGITLDPKDFVRPGRHPIQLMEPAE